MVLPSKRSPRTSIPSPGDLTVMKEGRVIGALALGSGTPDEHHEYALAGGAAV